MLSLPGLSSLPLLGDLSSSSAGGLLSGLSLLGDLTSPALLLSTVPGLLGISDTDTPLAALAPVADLVFELLPVDLAVTNGIPISPGTLEIPSGLPLLGLGLPGGIPPDFVLDLLGADSPLAPLSSLLAPAQPTAALSALQPLSGFLLF